MYKAEVKLGLIRVRHIFVRYLLAASHENLTFEEASLHLLSKHSSFIVIIQHKKTIWIVLTWTMVSLKGNFMQLVILNPLITGPYDSLE